MAAFVRHAACEECGSSDAKAVYDDESSHCFACQHTVPSKEYLEENKKPSFRVKASASLEEQKPKEKVLSNKIITEEQKQDVKDRTEVYGNDYRGISDEVLKFYGCRTEIDDNEVQARYYPYTIDGELAGFKVRKHPKSFGGNVGETGNTCDLYGQFRFPHGGKYLLIVEGEEDAMAAYQMFLEYSRSKSSDFVTAVVSLGQGAKSKKQVANNYEFLNKFDNIILGLDADAAGEDAIDDLIAVLPKGKVKITKWSKAKDPNEYLENDNGRQFIYDFYNAERHVPTGIIGSHQISAEMRVDLNVPKIPLPPFMHRLQDMMAGGIPLGRIVNLGSASGTGKSTIADEIIYHMLFHSPHMTGVVTLESTCGQYGLKLLSRHIGKKIELLPGEKALELLNSPEVKNAEAELLMKDDGSPRWYLVDDRDGGVENIQDAIENLIISCNCKVIVLDPIHDIIAALPLEQQDNFMSWQKGLIKSHNVTFINICHTRKTQSGSKAGSTGADLHEEDLMGNSALYKSAACNLMFTRNKEAEDEVERNTTIMKATKIRWTGKTGVAGKYYYDNETHTLHDLEDM